MSKREAPQLTQNQRKLAILVGRLSRRLNGDSGGEGLDLAKEMTSGFFGGIARGLTGEQLDIGDAAPNVALENSQIQYLQNLQTDKKGYGLYNLITSLDDDDCSRLLLKKTIIESELKGGGRDSDKNRELYSHFLEYVRQAYNAGTRAKSGHVLEARRRFEGYTQEPASFPKVFPKVVPLSSLHSSVPRARFDGPPGQASGGQAAGFFPPRDSELLPPARDRVPAIISEPAGGGGGWTDEGGGGWEAPPTRGGGGRRVEFAWQDHGDEVHRGDAGKGGPIEAVKKIVKEQVGNRLHGIAGVGTGVAGVADALLAGKTDEALMRVGDVGDNVVSGVVLAKSPSELHARADERREEENDRRVEQEIPVDSTTSPGFFESTANRAGALLVDTPLHTLGVVIGAVTLDSTGVKENAQAVGSDLIEGLIGGEPLQTRDRRAEDLRESRRQAEINERLEVKQARGGGGGPERSPRGFPGADATADIVFQGNRGIPLRPHVDDEEEELKEEELKEEELKLNIRKSGRKRCFKSYIPKCCSCCSCLGLEPSDFEYYTLKPKNFFSFEYEEKLLEKVRSRVGIAEEEISLEGVAKHLSQCCTKTDDFIDKKEVNKDEFISELTFASTDKVRKNSQKNTLFRTIFLNQNEATQDSQKTDGSQLKIQDKHIKIGDCEIKEINIVDLKSNVHKSRIFLDKNGVEAIKRYTESHEKLFLKYFLNDTTLTAKTLLNQAPGDEPSLAGRNFNNKEMEDAQKKASEASRILVERKMERGDFKFDLDDPDKEIAYVKVLREIDKSGNVKKDNKVEIKTGKEFSDSLKHINIHVGDGDYIQIHLEDSKNGPKVQDNLSFYRKDSSNNFDKLELKNSKHIKNSKITIISHDNKETKFKDGDIKEKDIDPEEKKSSCFPCLKKAKPEIKESGVIRYDGSGWKIEFDKDAEPTSGAKLIISANGKISFDEKDPENKKIADAFRKTLGDKNEVRKFKLLKDDETYEVTIGGTESGRTFRNTAGILFRGKTHGNGILEVKKISGNNLTEGGAVIDGAGDGAARKSWTACFGRRGKGKKDEVIDVGEGGGGEGEGRGGRGGR
jgi:hypothetical protein